MKRWIAMTAALAVSTVGLSVSVGTPAQAADRSSQSVVAEPDPDTETDPDVGTDPGTDPDAGTDPPETRLGLDRDRAAAAPTPPRRNGYKTLILLHGFNKDGSVNCNDYWGDGKVKKYLNDTRGWAGRVKMLTYYKDGGKGCTDIPGAGKTNRSIEDLGADLAWHIWSEYSQHGVPVDVIAHSMGGLVTRVAITGTQHQKRTLSKRRFPPYLYIEDVATLASPHEGAKGWVGLAGCSPKRAQVCQMKPRSPFLRSWIEPYGNPQSGMGTDWSAIASGSDGIVESGSALNRYSTNWGHKYLYNSSYGLGHGEMSDVTENRGFKYDIAYCHHNDRSCVMTEPSSRNRWRVYDNGAGPLWLAAQAVYYDSW